MKENSFKSLQKEQEAEFEKKSAIIKKKINSETSAFRFFGDIIDLYFSKMTDVFVALAGGGETVDDEELEAAE